MIPAAFYEIVPARRCLATLDLPVLPGIGQTVVLAGCEYKVIGHEWRIEREGEVTSLAQVHIILQFK